MVACLGASASFIGLLFVCLSVVLQKAGEEKIADRDRLLAESSYAALINIFFVSLFATLPHETIGYTCLSLALIGLLSCWRLIHSSHIAPLITSAIVYVTELVFAVNLVTHPHHLLDTGWLEAIIVALFAISLIRAWGLTGIHKDRR